jgi:hypothetical protein
MIFIICVGLSVVFTNTAKADLLAINTPSSSPPATVITSASPTKTTGTPVPTKSPTSGPSPTITSTPTITPTTTLIPLPEITLIFPLPTSTPSPSRTPADRQLTQTPVAGEQSDLNQLSPRFKILTGLIVVLWIVLAGFAIIYIRQMR